MSHPAELSLAMHADDALQAHEAAMVEQHLATCDVCSARVATLREESRIVAAVLAYDPASVSVPEAVSFTEYRFHCVVIPGIVCVA